VHTLFNEFLGLLEELTSHEHNGCGAITDLVVLGSGDVNEGLGSGVNDVEETDKGGTVVGDGDASSVVDKFVHSAGSCKNIRD